MSALRRWAIRRLLGPAPYTLTSTSHRLLLLTGPLPEEVDTVEKALPWIARDPYLVVMPADLNGTVLESAFTVLRDVLPSQYGGVRQ